MTTCDNRKYFFDKGISFECTRCGFCCTGGHGTVYINSTEILRIADFLNISTEELKKNHLYPFRDSFSLKEFSDGRCHFYENGCIINEVKPCQCSTYPFWLKNLRSERIWEQVCHSCPGLNRGRRYSKQEILEIVGISVL